MFTKYSLGAKQDLNGKTNRKLVLIKVVALQTTTIQAVLKRPSYDS